MHWNKLPIFIPMNDPTESEHQSFPPQKNLHSSPNLHPSAIVWFRGRKLISFRSTIINEIIVVIVVVVVASFRCFCESCAVCASDDDTLHHSVPKEAINLTTIVGWRRVDKLVDALGRVCPSPTICRRPQKCPRLGFCSSLLRLGQTYAATVCRKSHKYWTPSRWKSTRETSKSFCAP